MRSFFRGLVWLALSANFLSSENRLTTNFVFLSWHQSANGKSGAFKRFGGLNFVGSPLWIRGTPDLRAEKNHQVSSGELLLELFRTSSYWRSTGCRRGWILPLLQLWWIAVPCHSHCLLILTCYDDFFVLVIIGWVVATQRFFGVFTPIPGKMIHFDEQIFQMGWNYQLVGFCMVKFLNCFLEESQCGFVWRSFTTNGNAIATRQSLDLCIIIVQSSFLEPQTTSLKWMFDYFQPFPIWRFGTIQFISISNHL